MGPRLARRRAFGARRVDDQAAAPLAEVRSAYLVAPLAPVAPGATRPGALPARNPRTQRLVRRAAMAAGAGALVAGAVSTSALGAQLPPPRISSTTNAGYLAMVTSGSATLASHVVVPAARCHEDTPQMRLVTQIDAPPSVSATVVAITCQGAIPVYTGYIVAGGSWYAVPFLIAPGDTVVSSVSMSPSGSATQLRDITNGHRFRRTGAGATVTEVQVGIDAPQAPDGLGALPVPGFSPIGFSDVRLDGAAIGTAPVVGVALLNQNAHPEVLASDLNHAGNGFTVLLPQYRAVHL